MEYYVLKLNLCSEFTPQHGGYWSALYPDYLCADITHATKFDKQSIDSMLCGELPTFDDLWYRRPVKVT